MTHDSMFGFSKTGLDMSTEKEATDRIEQKSDLFPNEAITKTETALS